MEDHGGIAADGGRSAPVSVALLLPGMSLGATIFPPLPLPTIALDFNRAPPGDPSRVTMESYAVQLRDFLAGAPAWQTAERRIVVTHSFGGMLALHWLSSTPDAGVDGLVLTATTAGPMYDVLRLGLLGLRIPFAQPMRVWRLRPVTRLAKLILAPGPTRDVDFRHIRFTNEVALDLYGWRNTTAEAMRAYRTAMDGFDVRDRLPRITVPTVVLHGTRDALFGVDVARRLAAGLPNARLVIVPGAGHGLPITHGEKVVEAVRQLL